MIKITSFTYHEQTIENLNIKYLFKLPNICPHCGQIMSPTIEETSQATLNTNKIPVISFLMRCSSCKEFYALSYELTKTYVKNLGIYYNYYETKLIPYSYRPNIKYDLPQEIEKISSISKDIYIQCQVAEHEKLTQITGIGYRKFLEFLVKDYLINVLEINQEDIIKIPLSQAINKLDSEDIKSLAKASAWLGNDETHYNKKYLDKDLEDMKVFIRALTLHLSSKYSSKIASEFIKENSSKGS